MNRQPLPEAVRTGRIVAIGRRLAPERVLGVGAALVEAGVGAFELTLDDPDSATLRSISRLVQESGDSLLIGAGTVLSIDAARRAVDAGARFLVCPHTDRELVAWASDRHVPVFPGGMTPTEVYGAWTAGATAVKLFPASVVGPAFVRELRGPLPDIPLVPTGGVRAEDAGAFIRAGAVAVGLGSWLIGDGAAAGVRSRAQQVRDSIDAALAG